MRKMSIGKKVFATTMSVALAGAFMVPAGALAKNGPMPDSGYGDYDDSATTTYFDTYDYFGSIYLSSQNAISIGQMQDQYREERDAAQDALDTSSPTYDADYERIENEYDAKCEAYRKSVSKCLYSGYNFDSHIAVVNKKRAENGGVALTATEIAEIQKDHKSEISSNTAQTVSGASYNAAANTLTLTNYKSNEALIVESMGNNFKIKVVGTCELGGIYVYDSYEYAYNDAEKSFKRIDKLSNWGAGLSIEGAGTLTVNKQKNASEAIHISSENTAAALQVAKDVNLNLYADGNSDVVSVSGTTVSSAKNAMSFKGTTDGAKVTHQYNYVAVPKYRDGDYAYDAESVQEGTVAFNPNRDPYSYGNEVLCDDNAHVAWVSKYHLDAGSKLYVIDEWKVQACTKTDNSRGGYDITTTGKATRVPNANGAPQGYALTPVNTIPAGYQYSIADNSFVQYAKTATVGKTTYTTKNTGEAYFTKAQNKKKVTVPKTVKINGKKFTVTGITKKAFAKAKKAKTVTIKATKLTKKSVKGAFKGSKVKTVKVPKKQKKAYAKFFTKGVLGAKVTVK